MYWFGCTRHNQDSEIFGLEESSRHNLHFEFNKIGPEFVVNGPIGMVIIPDWLYN